MTVFTVPPGPTLVGGFWQSPEVGTLNEAIMLDIQPEPVQAMEEADIPLVGVSTTARLDRIQDPLLGNRTWHGRSCQCLRHGCWRP